MCLPGIARRRQGPAARMGSQRIAMIEETHLPKFLNLVTHSSKAWPTR
ncbi:hypothetical protein CBM2586_A11320 [Cupriavidus phytorum]|uniref:Uncharacterized protein n=1 Tax=Cupriavidus taiwanensis TaxID=164546 RepID=A0A975WSD2_9BURK|nr:hypothetical protein CBM2586_A11320 [Cupriavidus taiwanensis]